jgi:hypothetical protein
MAKNLYDISYIDDKTKFTNKYCKQTIDLMII